MMNIKYIYIYISQLVIRLYHLYGGYQTNHVYDFIRFQLNFQIIGQLVCLMVYIKFLQRFFPTDSNMLARILLVIIKLPLSLDVRLLMVL